MAVEARRHWMGLGGCPGLASTMELAIRFHLWASEQHQLTAKSIQQTWGVSRATAFRWLAAYRAATGRAA